MKYNYLLVKTGQITYQTPCGTYVIEYTNIGYLDGISWSAATKNRRTIYGETLQCIIQEIVDKNPYMLTELYRILYGIEE